MHELSIAQALVEEIGAWRQTHRPEARVLRATVVIGRLSGVDPEALAYAWCTACECTDETAGLRACRLETEQPLLEFACGGCGKKWERENFIFECPACGGKQLRRTGGRELVLKEIEVE